MGEACCWIFQGIDDKGVEDECEKDGNRSVECDYTRQILERSHEQPSWHDVGDEARHIAGAAKNSNDLRRAIGKTKGVVDLSTMPS